MLLTTCFISTLFGGSLGLAVVVTVALRRAASRVSHGANAVAATVNGYRLAIRLTVFLGLAAAPLVAVAMERVSVVEPDQQPAAGPDAPERLVFAHVGSLCATGTCPDD
jgi:hypothetical protein